MSLLLELRLPLGSLWLLAMKLIRHVVSSGSAYAALQPDGSALEITGDVFGAYQVTTRTIKPGKLLAPITPTTIIGIGLNYREHAKEGGKVPPERPLWFMKTPAAVQNPDDPIEIPTVMPSHEVDYEAELAIVIGKKCKNATKENALSYVLGYTCANDVSARDWQFKLGSGQFCHGKSFDTFCPLGPVLVTADELTEPNELAIRTLVNGEERQNSNTNMMIFDVPTIISFVSSSRTLLPGTVILTGTPQGVGYARTPPIWLKAGDRVSVEIEKIGTLNNPVILEKP
ncbi:MAG TPA: fumarylacetoacetate hydrolase family protein [Opitutaceae bacterium]|nr:fumarylacetoacetate hydrolase family protein [Opitutaceae bacterium]